MSPNRPHQEPGKRVESGAPPLVEEKLADEAVTAPNLLWSLESHTEELP